MSYSGGGFMTGSQGAGSQSSPGSKRSGPSSLRPVNIGQILTAQQAHPDAEFYIDGSEVKDITFVAAVRNMSKTTTNIGFLVEDGTGQIDVRQWIDAATDDSGQAAEIDINVYVRIIGNIKSFSGKRSINCNRVRVVKEGDELHFHLVELLYVSMYYRKGGLPGGGQQQNDNKPYSAGAVNPYNQAHNAEGGGADNHSYGDLPMLQRKIMQYISQQAGEVSEGINVGAILRHVGSQVGMDRLKEEVEQLTAEGHLYQTIDEDHVLPTN